MSPLETVPNSSEMAITVSPDSCSCHPRSLTEMISDNGLPLIVMVFPFGQVLHASSLISASACSSQNGMSMSRYIVTAVVRCSCASSCLPVRR
jgi:hypothetical protein